MPTFERPKKERSSPFFVQDRQNEEELLRLKLQNRMVNAALGGVLPEQPDPTIFRRVLDVACASGGWLIEAAQAYPTMSLFGIDINGHAINYAREQAAANHVADRIEFAIMDALLIIEFPTGFFDLVNMRFGGSFMLTWDWPKMLGELLRVTRPGGIVRVTESEIIHQSNSPALTQLFEMFQCAMFQSGHLFEQETTGIIAHLPRLLTQYGCQQVQAKIYPLEFQGGTPEGEAYYNNMMHFFRTLRPFLRKWGCISGDYDAIYQQALDEMRQSTFHSTWSLCSAWGTRPDSWPIKKDKVSNRL